MPPDLFAAGVEAVVAAERIAELEAAVGTLRKALREIVVSPHDSLNAWRTEAGYGALPDSPQVARARAALAATEPEAKPPASEPVLITAFHRGWPATATQPDGGEGVGS